MNHQPLRHSETSPWPHRLAVALACATLLLIWVGAVVTTTGAGMAVPDWPNTFGYNLFLYPPERWLLGPNDLFVEHGHRLFAAAVGMLTIALAAVTWKCDRRQSVRWLSLAAVLAVVGQGVLGGMRVVFDARTFAQIHGCVGPAFFALTVALVVVTSRAWRDCVPKRDANSTGLHVLASFTTFMAFGQLVLGSQLRHVHATSAPASFRVVVFFHLVLAAMLLAHAALLWRYVRRHYAIQSLLTRPAAWLLTAMSLQILLGLATWVVRYGTPAWLDWFRPAAAYTVTAQGALQTIVVSTHVAVGSLIIALALVITLRGLRFFRPAGQASQPAEGRLAARQFSTAGALA